MNKQCFYRISVKGIVVDNKGRILLAKEEDGTWEMLGGGLDHGEDAIDCLKREILEETGLEIIKVQEQPKYFVTAKKRDSDIYMANVIYEIELKNLDFKLSEECQELRFFSVDELKTIKKFSNVEKLLEILSS